MKKIQIKPLTRYFLMIYLCLLSTPLVAQPSTKVSNNETATIQKRSISLSAALSIAQEALKTSEAKGLDMAIVVVDHSGIPLVVLRSNNATEQFVEGARQKAWTSINLKASTKDLFHQIQSGKEDDNMLPYIPKSLFLMGGIPIIINNDIVGAVGAAGSPSGVQDDAIAASAVKKFMALLKS